MIVGIALSKDDLGIFATAVGVVLVNFLTAAALLGLAARAGVLRGILGRAHAVGEKQP